MKNLININHLKMMFPLMAVILFVALFFVQKINAAEPKVSEFGQYQGYSEAEV